MAALLALVSALCYGIADFAGGLLSRRADPTVVALIGQVGALALTLIAASVVPAPELAPQDLSWGALSGVGTGVGMVFLYRGLSRGKMSVVVPVAAVGGTAIPVVIGIAVLGDRPGGLALTGIAVAIPALWLVSIAKDGNGSAREGGVVAAVISSLGIALQYLALAQVGAGAGLWPIVAGRVAASLAIVPLVRRPSRLRGLDLRVVGVAVAIGGVAALALTSYMFAAQLQLVTVAVVLSSLYPVVPVLLGIGFLRERLDSRQAAGLCAAAAAVVLITL